jgi:hypothetical protein
MPNSNPQLKRAMATEGDRCKQLGQYFFNSKPKKLTFFYVYRVDIITLHHIK